MVYKLFLRILMVLMATCSVDVIAQKVWCEKDGIVVIEAENAFDIPSNSGWVKKYSLMGYFGSGYMVWMGSGDWGPESRPYDSITQKTRILTYRVKIETPGTYYLKVRNQHQHEDGDNDVWTSVNGSEWGKTYDWQKNEWSLDERGKWAKYELDKGIHKVELAGRSTGFSIDRLLLYHINLPLDSLNSPMKESKMQSR